ncbi:MAG: S8 family serine peptidase [Flammeovirgaceae bacterium]|nr:MAG: S8 family serine peptidase [Flammeovirgaceae bacterium]
MQSRTKIRLWIWSIFPLCSYVFLPTEGPAQRVVKNEYTVIHVKFREGNNPTKAMLGIGGRFGISAIDKLGEKYKAVSLNRIFPEAGIFEEAHRAYGLHLWYEIRFRKDLKLAKALSDYRKFQHFEYVDECKPYTSVWSEISEQPILESGSNDPLFANQWHFNNTGQGGGTPGADIKLLDAWKKETGSSNVIVAIIDAGIQLTHPDLTGALWVNPGEIPGNRIDDDGNGYVDDVHGYNFADNSSFIEGHFHGTHVAGTIGAVTNNGLGVSGIAGGSGSYNGARLMSCVGFGTIFTGGFEAAMVYAADNGAVISQNSWGGGSRAIETAINYFVNRAGMDNRASQFHQNIQTGPMAGGLVIFAAGNSNTSDPNMGYPASYPKVLAVASTDRDDKKSSFSNYGTWVDISAPGSNVFSTYTGNNYAYLSGTSMACPHVSGVAALVISKLQGPGLVPADVWNRLRLSARTINEQNPGFQGLLGAGRLDASLALRDPDNIPPAPITDLRTERVTTSSVVLKWTATGEDDFEGQALAYDLRYSTTPITPSNFGSATKVSGLPNPPPSGQEIVFEVRNLLPATEYFFALKSEDVFYNVSDISNVIAVTTLNPPIPELVTTGLSVNLHTGAVVPSEILVKNVGEDNLVVRLAVPELQPAPVGFATGAKGRLFAINTLANRVDELDCRTGILIRSISLPVPSTQNNEGLAFDGEYLYYGNANTVYKIRVSTGQVIRSFTLDNPYGITGLAWSGRFLYVSVISSNLSYLYEVDVDSGLILRTITSGFYQGLTFGGNRGTLFAVNGNFLTERNAQTGNGIKEFNNGGNAKGLGYSATEDLLFISKNNFIQALNPNTGEVEYSFLYPFTTALAADEYKPGWVQVTEQAVEIPSGSTRSLPLTFVATSLSDGQWHGVLRVLPMNIQHQPLEVPVTMQVTAAPDIEGIEAVDFGIQYKNVETETVVMLENRGFSDLEITAFTSGDSRVSLSVGSATLSPGQKLPVIVTFLSDETGVFESHFTISSNDPDESELVIPVRAQVLLAPALQVSPSSLSTTMQVGEQKTVSFTVTNTGESDLHYVVRFVGSNAPWITSMTAWSDTLTNGTEPAMMFEEEGFSVKANSPEPITGLVHPPQSDFIYAKSFFGNNFYRYNLVTDTWTLIGFTPENVVGQAAFLNGKLYFAGDRLHVFDLQSGTWSSVSFPVAQSTMNLVTDGQYIFVTFLRSFYRYDPVATVWVQLADVPPGFSGHVAGLSHFSGTIFAHDDGLSGIEGDGNTPLFKYFKDSNSWISTKSITGKAYFGSAVNPAGKTYFVSGRAPSNPAVNQISVLDILEGEWTTLLSPLNSASNPIYVSKAGYSGFYFVEMNGTSFGYYETPPAPEWISFGTHGGTLSPGQSQVINIILDASVLIDGTYTGNILVKGNHPFLSKEVPLTLTVVGAPDISVTGNGLVPGVVWLGKEFGLPVRVKNTGTAFLYVTDIAPNHPDVSVSSSNLIVPPGEEKSVTAYFLPSHEGLLQGQITFTNNDPDESAVAWSFSMNVTTSPVPQLIPSSLIVNLMSGDTLVQYLTLSNTGGGLMDYFIDSDESWLPSRSFGYLPAGESLLIPVTIDATGLTGGTYNGKFVLWHQGEIRAEVQVILTVISAPGIYTNPQVVDFGDRFVSYTHSTQVNLVNKGVLPLQITSIESTNPAFGISETGPVELMPMQSLAIGVTFQPEGTDSYAGNLVFQSNDPNESTYAIPVTGTGVNPPVASTDVAELQVELFQDEILAESVILQNTGGSELAWKVYSNTEFPIPVNDFTLLKPSPAELTSLVVDPATKTLYAQHLYYNRVYRYQPSSDTWVQSFNTHIGVGNNKSGGAVILNNRMYCVYSDDSLNLYIFHMILRNWSVIPNQLGAGTGTITTDGTALYLAGGGNFMRYDLATKTWKNLPLPSLVFLDGKGGLQYHNGFVYAHGGSGNGFARFNIFTEAWENLPAMPGSAVLGSAIDPVRNRYYAYGKEQLTYVYEYDIGYNVWSTYLFEEFEVNDGGIIVSNQPDYQGVYFIQGRSGPGFARFKPKNILNWLRPVPLAGKLEAVQNTQLGVNVSSYSLSVGQYQGLLNIASNDPVNNLIPVTVNMKVMNPAPSIVVPGEIKDTVDRVIPQTFALRIKNKGKETLTWNIAGVLPFNLSASKSSGALHRLEEEVIDITFNPAFFGDPFLDYTLVINSNDAENPQVPVRLLFTLPNKHPQVTAAPGPQLLTVDPLQILLDDVFYDPDGDPLTFSVSSSLPQFATVSMTGSTLTINPRLSGTTKITITATDNYNASTVIQFDAIVDRVTGIETDNQTTPLEVYPNPFDEKFTVRYTTHNPGNASVLVMDITGRVVYRAQFEESFGENSLELDGNNLKSGLYTFLLLQNKKTPSTKRLVKK